MWIHVHVHMYAHMYTCTCTHTLNPPSTLGLSLSLPPESHENWKKEVATMLFTHKFCCAVHMRFTQRKWVVSDSPANHNNNKSAQHRWGLDTRPCYCRGNRARETGPHVTAKQLPGCTYGVATMSRLLKNYLSLLQNIVSFIGLFCKRDL